MHCIHYTISAPVLHPFSSLMASGNPSTKPNETIISDFYKLASQNIRSKVLCALVERFLRFDVNFFIGND